MNRTVPTALAICLLVACFSGCSEATPTAEVGPELYINEIMAENDATLPDPDGSGGYSDWIEVYNAGPTDVDMSGMYLSDDPDRPTAHRIPDGVVAPAGGYVVFWADNDPVQGAMHANFKLDAAGEAISLADTSANGYPTIDEVTFPQLAGDTTYERLPDGSSAWRVSTSPSPGRPNE